MVSTDAHQMKISASLLSAQDMFVAISNSGETIELIEAAAIAHDQGAYVAVITNYEGSSITEKADLVLITTDQSRINDSQFINTQIATFNGYCQLSPIKRSPYESTLSAYTTDNIR